MFFRPPYGAHDAKIDAIARRLGLLEILWSIDSRDSEGADPAQIAWVLGSCLYEMERNWGELMGRSTDRAAGAAGSS